MEVEVTAAWQTLNLFVAVRIRALQLKRVGSGDPRFLR